jgi:hypothetical protein
MLRRLTLLTILSMGISTSVSGCRSCDSCHDYDGPVVGCESGSCGCGRAGSASSGYVSAVEVNGPTMSDEQMIYQ